MYKSPSKIRYKISKGAFWGDTYSFSLKSFFYINYHFINNRCGGDIGRYMVSLEI